jgi:tetratricopeptide (TPR) repeat protein
MRPLPGLPFLMIAASACSDAAPPTPAASQSAAAKVGANASAASSSSAKAPSKDAKKRAALLGHLSKGRKLAQEKKWKEALTELDKALAIEPKEGRVLSEIGWAAFNAGDLERAKKANKLALENTAQPERRAAVLYNIGRVAEEEKDKAAAKDAYAESLVLRYNAEVEKRYLAVGGAEGDIASPWSTCTEGFDAIKNLCDCLLAKKDDLVLAGEAAVTCDAEKSEASLGDERLSLVSLKVEFPAERALILVAKDGKKHRAVALLGADFSPGAFGVNNFIKVDGGKARKVKSRTLVSVAGTQENLDTNMAGLEACRYTEKAVTHCVLGEGDGATKCTRPLPLEISSGCGPGVEVDPADLDPETLEFVKALKANAKPPETVKASHDVDDTGKLVSKVESGDASLLPKHAIGERQLIP